MPALRSQSSLANAYVRWHFPVAMLALLALSLVAFWDNLVSDVGQPSNSNPVMVVHGLFLLAWMILLVVQALLPATGRTHLHRQIGPWAFAIAAGVALSTLALFVTVWRGWSALSPEVLANRIALLLFAGALYAAWRTRRQPDWHKRLVYTGTLVLLDPVLARTYDPLVAPFMPSYPPGADDHLFYGYKLAVWLSLYLALLLYDYLRDARFHPVSLAAPVVTSTMFAAAFTLAPG